MHASSVAQKEAPRVRDNSSVDSLRTNSSEMLKEDELISQVEAGNGHGSCQEW